MSSFSARDLALLLPDKVVGDSYGLRHTDMKDGTEGELLKPKVDASKKVTRYFSGKAPTWAATGGESWPTGEEEPTVAISIDRTNQRDFKPAVVEDRRLARLAKVSAATSSATDVVEETVPPRRRRVYEAQVIVDDEEEESFLATNHEQEEEGESKSSSSSRMMSVGVSDAPMDDDENDIVGRRARVLKRMAEKQAEEAAAAAAVASSSSSGVGGSGRIRATAEEITVGDDEEEEEEEEEESEYETDSDESDDQIIKPVFVPKAKRATLQELAMKEAEEKIKEDKRLLEKEDRKRQTREMVAESIRRIDERDESAMTDAETDVGLPDDSDDAEHNEMEYGNWKVREMTRLMRDAQAREIAALEKADIERRRQMTDEQRIAEDKRLGVGKYDPKHNENKEKRKFMQKYYHKGAFYMDDTSIQQPDDVRKQAFDAPTLEDNFNFEALPKVLQVKNFGKRGRTKYTHLLDQDTSNFKERLQVDERVSAKVLSKRSGVGGLDDAGRLHKKPKG